MTTETTASAGTTPNTSDATTAATSTTAAPAADSSLLGADTATTQQAATDTTSQTADAAAETKTDAKAATTGAPEAYDLKAPEGTTLNPDVMTEFAAVAKELDLSQTAAQKLVETLAPKMAAANAAAVESYRADLVAQAKADKEFGGDKLVENMAVAKKALDAFGTPALRTLLNQSGMGDHPEVIRAFFKIGQAISEDKFVPGGKSPTQGERTAADRLYGK